MKRVSEEEQAAYIEAAIALKGGHRRQFMARIVNTLGYGGQSWAESELGWDRGTIRKGQQELAAGVLPQPNPGGPGRPRVEQRLPNLLRDIKTLADAQSQTDPTFKTTRLYTRLTACAARQVLIEQFGYTDAQLPGCARNPLVGQSRHRAPCAPPSASPHYIPTLSLSPHLSPARAARRAPTATGYL